MTGGVAQVVELLVCKCKALNSNPNATKKKVNVQLPFTVTKVTEKWWHLLDMVRHNRRINILYHV
jgi:hypothetical protein